MSKFSKYLKTIEIIPHTRKSKKLFFYVYRITNIVTKEHYYGSRTSDILPEEDLKYNYTSSSKHVNDDIVEYGIENFKFKIIKKFDVVSDMFIYESFLHNYFDVKLHKKFLNRSNATPNGFSTSGLVVVYDKNDNIFTVDIDDEKYISGEYKIYLGKANRGKINVIDDTGVIIKISLTDERILTGEVTLHTRIINKDKTTVFHIPSNKYIRIHKDDIDRDIHDFRHIKSKGMVVATDGVSQYYIENSDERYLNGELWAINKGTFTAIDETGKCIRVGIDDERYLSGNMTGVNKNKTFIKDNTGKIIMVYKSDERYLSGEFEIPKFNHNRPEWTCPHCGKVGKGQSNASRWHFDKCKNK